MKNRLTCCCLTAVVTAAAGLALSGCGSRSDAAVPLPMGGDLQGVVSEMTPAGFRLKVPNGRTYSIDSGRAQVLLGNAAAAPGAVRPGTMVRVFAPAMDQESGALHASRVMLATITASNAGSISGYGDAANVSALAQAAQREALRQLKVRQERLAAQRRRSRVIAEERRQLREERRQAQVDAWYWNHYGEDGQDDSGPKHEKKQDDRHSENDGDERSDGD